MNTTAIALMSQNLPAHLRNAGGEIDALSAGVTGGFGVLKIKGSKWHLQQHGEKTLITRPGSNEPAFALELVILKANPAISKVYYAKGYEDGSDAKPDCYSADGIRPAADAQSPQATTCAGCKWNQWGSRITDSGKKGKACADSRRLAVAAAGDLTNPLLLRVPAASLVGLASYGKTLAKHGLKDFKAVVTSVSFDPNEAYPLLVFNFARFLTEEEYAVACESAQLDVVSAILDSSEMSPVTEGEAAPATPAPVAPPARKTWQELAVERGLDEDDIATAEALGGPSTAKGLKVLVALSGTEDWPTEAEAPAVAAAEAAKAIAAASAPAPAKPAAKKAAKKAAATPPPTVEGGSDEFSKQLADVLGGMSFDDDDGDGDE